MKYKNINDYELIDMVRENDDYSRDVLYDKYYPIIKGIAYEYYHKNSIYGHDYEDFVQEGLIAFEKALSNFDENKDVLFYTFAIVCIRRSLVTYCRSMSSYKRNIPTVNGEITDYIILDNEADINSKMNVQEINKIINSVILDSEFDSGCIFELKNNGFSCREISILLDIPITTVEFKNRKLKNNLQKVIDKYV